jgi:hypothetical protein
MGICIEAGRAINVATLLRSCEAFRVPIAQLLRGLPSRLPFARAFRSPARTRSWISARSNSAIAPII